MPKSFTDWQNKILTQDNAERIDGDVGSFDFATAETILVAALGPGGVYSDPASYGAIGMAQGVSVAQSRQVQQAWEIGSAGTVIIPSRKVSIQLNISKLMVEGNNLIKATHGRSTNGYDVNTIGYHWDKRAENDTENQAQERSGDFYINLASNFFMHPTTLAIFMYDMDANALGAFALINCYLQSHQYQFSAQQTILVENCSFKPTAIKGISVYAAKA